MLSNLVLFLFFCFLTTQFSYHDVEEISWVVFGGMLVYLFRDFAVFVGVFVVGAGHDFSASTFFV